jgi:hypothetical protein
MRVPKKNRDGFMLMVASSFRDDDLSIDSPSLFSTFAERFRVCLFAWSGVYRLHSIQENYRVLQPFGHPVA